MIRADKRFGQHFLVNEGITDRIASTVQRLALDNQRAVIEFGPGPGALTAALLGKGLRVTAVELDGRMIDPLRERFRDEIAAGRLTLLHADALKVPLDELARAIGSAKAVACGNLPYNVGSQIVFRYLEEFPPAEAFCYMLQKEVVLKFISGFLDDAGRRDYGPPGVKLAWSCRFGGHFWVKPGSFAPPPKVDSGVFWCERLPKDQALADALERGGAYDRASDVLEKAFRHRRKMLKGALPVLAGQSVGTRRAEELSPVDLFRLAELCQTDREE